MCSPRPAKRHRLHSDGDAWKHGCSKDDMHRYDYALAACAGADPFEYNIDVEVAVSQVRFTCSFDLKIALVGMRCGVCRL